MNRKIAVIATTLVGLASLTACNPTEVVNYVDHIQSETVTPIQHRRAMRPAAPVLVELPEDCAGLPADMEKPCPPHYASTPATPTNVRP